MQNEFYTSKNGDVHGWCKPCNNKITYEKQLARKVECVKYKGGKCIVCNYDKYIGALDFHHINPEEKEFNIAQLRSYSLEFLTKELNKCVLLSSHDIEICLDYKLPFLVVSIQKKTIELTENAGKEMILSNFK